MEIQGTITHILEPIKGTSAKGDWTKQDIIIKTEGDYPKDVCLTLWNASPSPLYEIGKPIKASLDLSSREHNGKWYSEIKAWKVEPVTQEATKETNDLPF